MSIVKILHISGVLLMFLCIPTIHSSMVSLLGCRTIGEKNLVATNMLLEGGCYGTQHSLLVVLLAVPSIAVYSVFLPFFGVMKLRALEKSGRLRYSEAESVDDVEHPAGMYTFVFCGYKEDCI